MLNNQINRLKSGEGLPISWGASLDEAKGSNKRVGALAQRVVRDLEVLGKWIVRQDYVEISATLLLRNDHQNRTREPEYLARDDLINMICPREGHLKIEGEKAAILPAPEMSQ